MTIFQPGFFWERKTVANNISSRHTDDRTRTYLFNFKLVLCQMVAKQTEHEVSVLREAVHVVRNFETMKLRIFLVYFLLASCSGWNEKECNIPDQLKNEITAAVKNQTLSEQDFLRINNIINECEVKESLNNLRNCIDYKNSILVLLKAEDNGKRTLAYRLIGSAADDSYNPVLISRLNIEESSLCKTWNATALMSVKAPESSTPLFKLFSSDNKDLPLRILLGIYLKYDPPNVKKTAWKFVDSENRREQILAIQCLSSYEENKKLQVKLKEFLSSWDLQSKGWVISSMSQQNMGKLRPLLEQYANVGDLKEVIILALKNSPTDSDKEYAKQLGD